ncbi:MAG: crossover junction endodeoxyribonuclease RuvC [Candidatus Margulisiibacteriota bacterium]
MVILGLDPGLATTGYGLIEKKGSKLRFIEHGILTTPPKMELSKRLLMLSNKLKDLLSSHQPTSMAIEELFFAKNVTTAMVVSQARGVLLLTAEQAGIEAISSYTPLQVKTAVCGYGKAEKQQVQYMVKQLLNLPDIPKPDDAADGLALAICHSHFYRIKSLS